MLTVSHRNAFGKSFHPRPAVRRKKSLHIFQCWEGVFCPHFRQLFFKTHEILCFEQIITDIPACYCK